LSPLAFKAKSTGVGSSSRMLEGEVGRHNQRIALPPVSAGESWAPRAAQEILRFWRIPIGRSYICDQIRCGTAEWPLHSRKRRRKHDMRRPQLTLRRRSGPLTPETKSDAEYQPLRFLTLSVIGLRFGVLFVFCVFNFICHDCSV
jgi:hypothetical protein